MSYYTERPVKGSGTGGQFNPGAPKSREAIVWIAGQPAGTKITRNGMPFSHHIADGARQLAKGMGLIDDKGLRTSATAPGDAGSLAALPDLTAERFIRKVVTLGELFVDPRVQREEQSGFSQEIAANFDAQEFADEEIIVADRDTCEGGRGPSGERYAILDHQHMVAGAREYGYPPSTPVRVKAFARMTLKQQAQKFRALNGHRRAVKALSDFRVALTEGDPRDLAIHDELEIRGLKAGSSGTDGSIACIGMLRRAHDSGSLAAILDVLMGAWGIRSEAYQAHALGSVQLLLDKARSGQRRTDADRRHLTNQMKKIQPSELLSACASRTAAGRSPQARGANFLVTQYNKNLRGRQPLDFYT